MYNIYIVITMIGDSYSASKRPMCIASVRVEALRASGLRAAAAQRISSLYEEEHNADVVRKKHSECLQGTGISYSSNASSSSSLYQHHHFRLDFIHPWRNAL